MQGDEFEGKTVIADLSQIRASTKQQKKGTPCLVQYNGTGTGKRFLIDKAELNLGRAATSDIVLADNSVSRTHAHIYSEDMGVFVEDAGSANGTYINETKINERYKLSDQDLIRLGILLLKFFSADNVDGFIQDKIYQLATIDAGTQIFNKQYLKDTLESEFRKAKSSAKNLTILVFDLDHFKKVNDTYGHNAGDQVLRDLAKVVKSCIRREDIFARFGGEEFVVILPNTSAQQSVKVAETIRQKCEETVHTIAYVENGQNKQVAHTQTISIGIGGYNPNMTAPKDLLELADQKLYQSKKDGRNRLTL